MQADFGLRISHMFRKTPLYNAQLICFRLSRLTEVPVDVIKRSEPMQVNCLLSKIQCKNVFRLERAKRIGAIARQNLQ